MTKKAWTLVNYTAPSQRTAEKLASILSAEKLDKNELRRVTGLRPIIQVDEETKTVTFWRIQGIAYACTDSHFLSMEEAVNRGSLSQEYLQELTGYRLPIDINEKEHFINFEKF